jgi:hypothetical protein
MKLIFAAMALACAPVAWACQPPRDMPVEPKAALAYWEREHVRFDRIMVDGAATLVVARVTLAPVNPASPPKWEDGAPASLVPMKVLRGAAAAKAIMVNKPRMCEDFPVRVAASGVYLLAMKDSELLLAVPLVAGQERAGVAAFFARIAEPSPWK